MQRRDFLRSTLAGAAALVPRAGFTASDWITTVPMPMVEPLMPEPLMPIWEAAVTGRWSIVKEWLRRDPTLINVTGGRKIDGTPLYDEKITLFHQASLGAKADVEFLKYLVAQGADVNEKDNGGATSLHYAASFSSVEVVQYLISQGADINALDVMRWTPLHCAAGCNSNVAVLQYLISQGADVNALDDIGMTPLHAAAHYNDNVEVFAHLVLAGANVHATDDFGRTPLDVVDSEERKQMLCEAVQRVMRQRDMQIGQNRFMWEE